MSADSRPSRGLGRHRSHRPVRSLSWELLTAALLTTLLVTGSQPAAHAAPAAEGSTCSTGTEEVIAEEPWPQVRLGLDTLDQHYRGWGITVAVISSGVSAGHPQLHGRVLDGVILGDSGPANADCLGFGTAIAGAAVAAPVTGTPLMGVAPQSSVLPVRLPDWVVNPSTAPDETHRAQASDLLGQGIKAALQHNPQVLVLPSVSLPDGAQLRAAVAAAEEQGCLLVEGAPATADDTYHYPAAYPEVLVVEGTSAEGELAQTALGSDRIDLIAPGIRIPVLAPDKGHLLVSSNAVAAGYAAGAAALVLEAVHPRSAADLRARLKQSRVPSVYGGIPVLDPSAALSPPGSAASGALSGTQGRLLAGRPEPERASIAAVGIAATAILLLAIIGFVAAALYRGRSRGWRPAGQPEPVPTPPDHQLLTDDPFRPPGQYGAWWLARNLDADAGADSAAGPDAGRRTPRAPYPADSHPSAHGGQP
ncbi:MAG TPA: S8 family serine peptidase [Kineosporiaceae bacterium]|nr:S8 family serine peptidase [Kineosporiaceae bacterium]